MRKSPHVGSLPSSQDLERELQQLARSFRQHSKLTRSPVDESTALVLDRLLVFRDRTRFKELDEESLAELREIGFYELKKWIGQRTAEHALKPATLPSRRRAWLTIAEVAALLDMSKHRARTVLRHGRIKLERFGNKDIVARESIERISRQKKRAQSKLY